MLGRVAVGDGANRSRSRGSGSRALFKSKRTLPVEVAVDNRLEPEALRVEVLSFST